MTSLWGDSFNISTEDKTKDIVKKIKQQPKKVKEQTTEKVLKSAKVSLDAKLTLLTNEVNRILGSYKDNTVVIKTYDDFINYIDACINNGVVAVDTETNNSLDPITCKIMGLCLYTPNQKNAYIPVNHIDKNTGERLDWQITESQIKEQLDRLKNTKILMHNGKFDYQVIKCTCNCVLNIYWDTMIAAKILDENEYSAGLKQQFIEKINPEQEKYSIDHLFSDIDYAIIDPFIFALYAATDAYMTYKLYEWQLNQFNKPNNQKLLNLFLNIEMPVVVVTAEMELTGVCVDKEYAQRLSDKYHRKLDLIDEEIQKELSKYKEKIDAWRLTKDALFTPIALDKTTGKQKIDKNGSPVFQKSKNEQLKDPIELTSPTQLAILLYDVLNVGVIDKKNPRGTGEEILKKINLPLCKLILDKRGILKLINTYIDKIVELSNASIDGRVRTHFNQLGAGTGRFSSSDPINLQNIPSHENSIRMIFTSAPGYTLVGGDYSQQEPRILSQFSGDENMINAYKEGKDLYAVMAAGIYHNKYEDNKEFFPDGTMNPEGKKRRTNTKSLLLGLMYGRGIKSIAEQIKSHAGEVTPQDIQEAENIQNGFFEGFPKVKDWINKTESDAKINGYVEDLWGRRRRLPDIQLPRYELNVKDNSSEFNPLLRSRGINPNSSIKLIEEYEIKLNNCKNKRDVDIIKADAAKLGISVKDNGGFISQAQRQCVNARIQGSAASMSKKAMIAVYNDPVMKNLGFKLSIAVHDELIGECPIENAEAVKERLSTLMINAALPECTVPMKCDTDSFKSWYLDVYTANVKEEYENLMQENKDTAFQLICDRYSESTPEILKLILDI